ncbi:hypothetical protein B0T24DRAFT_300664 [Lasiosphaeria ovina]|uniref:Uncharacterized protein n=1 Tax=Lasiosphaeria ovina TaxID=92902 RepID=A0AAE0K5Y7_9PEZI|nr:hypothetical protein B0T24DRAFT_300664 [Lasiosphaeria ovina]
MPHFPSTFRSRRNSAPPLSPFDTADTMPDRAGRTGRRRPFSTLMKKLANLKGSAGDGTKQANAKHGADAKKRQSKNNNNPYPQSGPVGLGVPIQDSHYSVSTSRSGRSSSITSIEQESGSVRLSTDGLPPPTAGGRSMAPTVSTDHTSTALSHGASSLAGTSRTANGGIDSRRGGDSTFSSPAPSVRSLTTTLTTIQSMAPNGAAPPQANGGNSNSSSTTPNQYAHQSQSNSQIIHFNQPFPTSSPASAIPAHLTPVISGGGGGAASTTGHPTTYASATANNLLTDNASILTLASSSKRRRRRSFDTDASVRALAPSSLFGGSRESLPLSILSANMDAAPGGAAPTTPGLHRGPSGIANERTSIYSATGILASERNSFYAKPTIGGSTAAGAGVGATGGDAASVRSGLLGHGRPDSVSGSIGGGLVTATSPLASPRDRTGGSANGTGGADEKDGSAGTKL